MSGNTGKQVTIIAAVARNRVIGNGPDIPWHLPEDFRHFRESTLGKTLVMGRKTFDSIGKPLPGRTTFVVTSQPGGMYRGQRAFGSVEAAIAAADGPGVMIAGGGQVYAVSLPLASKMILSEVDAEPEGDILFPEFSMDEWELTGSLPMPGFTIRTFERKSARAANG